MFIQRIFLHAVDLRRQRRRLFQRQFFLQQRQRPQRLQRQCIFLYFVAFNDQHHLTATTHFILLHPGQQFADRRTGNGFPGLGQFARQHHVTVRPPHGHHVLQTFQQTVG
ncbi:hypothetical protein D3C71_1727170 [compost metagenome]